MRTKEQYVEGLKKMRRNLYFGGDKIARDHEVLVSPLEVIGLTFDAAYDPETEGLCTAVSHLSGEKINRFCHVHQSADVLHNKQEMTRVLCRKAGYCIQRCMGIDAVNALNAVSYEAGKANNGQTEYYQNFLKWL